MTARTDQVASIRDARPQHGDPDRLDTRREGAARHRAAGRLPLLLRPVRGRRGRRRGDRSGSRRAARRGPGDEVWTRARVERCVEINFDGIVGPSHNYAGLSLGNLAATAHAGDVSLSARRGAAGARQDARATWRSGWRRGSSCRCPAPTPAWLAALAADAATDRALLAGAWSASAMWTANAATVSPAPDTADGRCHLTVANLVTMPHRAHEWPDTLRQLALAFADAAPLRGPRPGPALLRRRGRGQPHAAGRRRTARRASRSSSTAAAAGAFPRASTSRRAARSRGATGSIPARVLFVEQIARGDRRGRVPQRRRRGGQRARAVRATSRPSPIPQRAYAAIRAALPEARDRRGARQRGQPGRGGPLATCSTPSWSPCPRASMALVVPARSLGERAGARAGSTRCSPATARSAGCIPVDVRQSMANGGGPGLPAAARGGRSGDGRSALPARRGQGRRDRAGDRARTGPSRSTRPTSAARRSPAPCARARDALLDALGSGRARLNRTLSGRLYIAPAR